MSQESSRFLRPPANDLSSDDNEPGAMHWWHQLGVCAFLAASSTRNSPGTPITMQCRDQCRIHRQLNTTTMWQSVDRNKEIQVPNNHVRGHSSAGLSAYPRCDALNSKTASANAHEARWWPKTSERQPHRQAREDRGNRSRNLLKSNTRNSCSSIRV